MARPARLNVAGGLYHVIQRGNNRQLVFFGDDDRRAFLNRLERCAAECTCTIHAYCLMGNHLHLLVQTDQPNLSVFGQRLFGSYTKWANRRHRRVGHLFQGRFSSSLVDKDPYLLQLSRYIHLNPVKARIVRQPEDYPWSSLRAYLPRARGASWVHTSTTLAYFGGSRQRYMAFVHERMGEEWGDGLMPAPVPPAMPAEERDGGAGAPRDQCEGVSDEVVGEVLRAVAQATGVPVAWLQQKYTRQPKVAQAKALAASLLRQRTTLTLREIGQRLGGISAPAVAQHLQLAPRSLNILNA